MSSVNSFFSPCGFFFDTIKSIIMKVECAKIVYPVRQPLLPIRDPNGEILAYRVPICLSSCSKPKDLIGGNITAQVIPIPGGAGIQETFSLGLNGIGVSLGATGDYLVAPQPAVALLILLGLLASADGATNPYLTPAGQASKITLFFA